MDELHWTETALRDLNDIGSYIAFDNPRAAENIVRRIVETVAALAYHPKMGRMNEDGQTRRLVVTGTPYIAVYRLGSASKSSPSSIRRANGRTALLAPDITID